MAANGMGRAFQYNYMTNFQKLHKGIWPWTVGLKSRLPMHYKIRYCEKWMKESKPVFYKPETCKYIPDEFGQPQRVENIPVAVTYTRESNISLLGGEGLIVGLKRKNGDVWKPRVAAMWKPKTLSRVLYSEILHKWMQLTVTIRTLDQIDEAGGFDFYILKTHEVDLKSQLGMTLKREMLLTLARRSMYSENPTKCNEVFDKYKEFVMPEEEAEWVGLSLFEAERKQHAIEEKERLAAAKPLKLNLLEDLRSKLKDAKLQEDIESSQSWLSKLSPFKKSDDKAESS